MKVVKAAAVQMSPVLYSRDGTVEKIVRKIHETWRTGSVVRNLPRNGCVLVRILQQEVHR